MHVRCRHVDGSIAEPTAPTQPVKKKKSRSSGGSGRSTKRRKKENGGPTGATGHASQAAAAGTGSSLSSLSEARPPGCTWVGMLRDEVTHQRECPCELLLCQCGCGREYERQEFNEKDGSCPDQADSCEFCGETMRARELSEPCCHPSCVCWVHIRQPVLILDWGYNCRGVEATPTGLHQGRIVPSWLWRKVRAHKSAQARRRLSQSRGAVPLPSVRLQIGGHARDSGRARRDPGRAARPLACSGR
jgi:hypothetical protein